MNNLYKLFAFLCLVFISSSISAQSRSANITSDGLIILDASSLDLAKEYVADMSRYNIKDHQQAYFQFKKYIDRTTGRGMDFLFDFANQKMYIVVDAANQYLVPKSHGEQINVTHFNEVLRKIHVGEL